ncbi:MAG: tetratricopeptide repeat protein, partial [Planctomycetota bacterium]
FEDALKQYEQTIEQFSSDVVARNGRAEVLRELNRFEDALKQYEQTIEQFSSDVIARTGLATLLMKMERFDEALTQVGDVERKSQRDWINYHLRGMILLMKGDIREAAEIFETGVSSCPMPKQVKYFKSALAMSRLKMRDAERALEAVSEETGAIPDLLRMHAYGEQDKYRECELAHQKLINERSRKITDVCSLLFDGYLSKNAASTRTQRWEKEVFMKEAELLLKHAA